MSEKFTIFIGVTKYCFCSRFSSIAVQRGESVRKLYMFPHTQLSCVDVYPHDYHGSNKGLYCRDILQFAGMLGLYSASWLRG